MGELFRQIHPESPLTFTGERMVTGEEGAIQAEHYHRYFLARELCRGKDVLDVASGEGYGSAFLAQTARSVVGVDIDPATVDHASREYGASNLRYAVGDAVKLPLQDHSVDVVVSFETIEHVSNQEAFLAEVKRVLRTGGFFLVSTPDTGVYSALGTEANPYHVREMTDGEFREALGRAFRRVSLIRQRAITGSLILADEVNGKAGNPLIFEQRDSHAFEADHKLMRAPFLLAIASDNAAYSLNFSLYIQTVNITDMAAEVKAELRRLRDLEEKVRQQEPAISKAICDAATVPVLQAEIEHLRRVEDAAREQIASGRFEVEAQKRMSASFEQHMQSLRGELDAAREKSTNLANELKSERKQVSSLQSQLDISASLARQQSLTVQRNLLELQSARQEIESHVHALESYKQELENSRKVLGKEIEDQMLAIQELNRQLGDYKQWFESYKAAYEQSAKLIIPMRIRSAVPASLKSPLRAAKRAVRSILRPSP